MISLRGGSNILGWRRDIRATGDHAQFGHSLDDALAVLEDWGLSCAGESILSRQIK
jgi:hypothetical protein